MGCSSSFAAKVQTVEVEVWHDEIAEYNQAMMRSSAISPERERQHMDNNDNKMCKVPSNRSSSMTKVPSSRSRVSVHRSYQSTAGSSSVPDGKERNVSGTDNTSKTLVSTFAPAEFGDLYLDFSGAPSKNQGSDLAVELAAIYEEVEADQEEGEDFHSWNASSDWKRNHVSHEVKLNAFLQSLPPDDMEEKVKQMRRRDAAKSLGTSLSSARPQIAKQPHLISEDSFNSSELQASLSADE